MVRVVLFRFKATKKRQTFEKYLPVSDWTKMFNYDVISPLSRHDGEKNNNTNTDDSINYDDLEFANIQKPPPSIFPLRRSKPTRPRHGPNLPYIFMVGAILIGLVLPLLITVCVLVRKLDNTSDTSDVFSNNNWTGNRAFSTKGNYLFASG